MFTRKMKYPFFVMITVLSSFKVICQATHQPASFQTADSLYTAGDWSNAIKLYKELLPDTSTNSLEWQRLGFAYFNLGNSGEALTHFKKSEQTNPPTQLQPFLYSRMARAYSATNNREMAYAYIEKAISAGYLNFSELDTLKEYAALRNDAKFKELRNKIYAAANPCMTDPHAREFDFWVGEWDVYITGTRNYAGHSLIQMISRGCAILENWDSPNSTGKSINFVDPVTNKWKQSWAGSYANGIQEFMNGEYKDSAMRFEFETKDAQGKKLTGKFTFYNQGPNQVRQLSEISADDGKTWNTNYDFTYKRKK